MRQVSSLSMIALLSLAALSYGVPAARAEPITPSTETVKVEGKFYPGKPKARKEGKSSNDISGISCARILDGARVCFVIDDQGEIGQTASLGFKDGLWTLKANTDTISLYTADTIFRIIGDAPTLPNGTFGKDCIVGDENYQKPEMLEFDGEGVAYGDGFFYAIGSHGCGRKNKEFKTASFAVARIKLSGEGAAERIDLSRRLYPLLRDDPDVGKYFGRQLQPDGEPRGLNIEGLAYHDGRLYAGLRAPVLAKTAFILSVSARAVFESGAAVDPKMITVAMPDGRGIRDLATTENGKLVILAGPEIGEDKATSVGISSFPNVNSTAVDATFYELAPGPGKAEAILPLDDNGDTVIVLYDGAENGGPQVFRLSPLQPVSAESATAPVAASPAALSPTAKKKSRFSRQDRRICRKFALRRLAQVEPATNLGRRRIFQRSYRACLSKRR